MKKKKDWLNVSEVGDFLRCPACFWRKVKTGRKSHIAGGGHITHLKGCFLREMKTRIGFRMELAALFPKTFQPRPILIDKKPRQEFSVLDAKTMMMLSGRIEYALFDSATGTIVPVSFKIASSLSDRPGRVLVGKLHLFAYLLLGQPGIPPVLPKGAVLQALANGPLTGWEYQNNPTVPSAERGLKIFRAAVRTLRLEKRPPHSKNCPKYKKPQR